MNSNKPYEYPKQASSSVDVQTAFMNNTAPVVITQEEIDKSNKIKESKPKGLRRTDVYRAAMNQNYVILQMVKLWPSKFRRQSDVVVGHADTVLSLLAIAYDDAQRRYDVLGEVLALENTMHSQIECQYKMGHISKDMNNKFKSLDQSIRSQVAAWRAKSVGQSCNV